MLLNLMVVVVVVAQFHVCELCIVLLLKKRLERKTKKGILLLNLVCRRKLTSFFDPRVGRD